MTHFAKLGKFGLLLEGEVAPGAQSRFEKRYLAATGAAVAPGNPQHYQNQPNKRGGELRVYFNDPGMAVSLEAHGIHVEHPRKGYQTGKYRYRFNNNKLWWKLVEVYGLRLGAN
ncbi:MAG TPA: hypothetical protein VFC78_04290 [Tepidisphaeraceae bacterium]|nr:hypothetical protein [Tepidisphaeraceae bacterium]